jgi:hypothetical protein
MKKIIFRLLAVALTLSFLFPVAAYGATGNTPARQNGVSQQSQQATTQKLTPEERQARRQARMAARKARIKEQREKVIARRIARLEKVKAAMEKNGKTGDPKYQKVLDQIAKLQARLDKLSTTATLQ